MPNMGKFLSAFKGGLDEITYGPEQEDANATPSKRDLAAASIPKVQNPKGVWAILAQVARMRGQNRLSELFAAKQEQDRQLKNRDTESQIESRSTTKDLNAAYAENLRADNERAEEDAKWTRATKNITALESGEGEVTGVKKNVAPTFGPEGYEAAGSPGMTQLKMENPEVELPTGQKVRPRTAQQKIDAATEAKIQEEMFKTHNIGKDTRAVNFGLGFDLTNKGEPDTDYEIWKSQQPPGADTSIEAFYRKRTKLTERDPAYDEPLMRYDTLNAEGEPVQRFGTRGELKGKEFPSVTASMVERHEARKRLLPGIQYLKDLSEKVISKTGLMQKAGAKIDEIQAAMGSDDDYITYIDARKALAADLAVVQQGSRPSDRDVLEVWAPRIPDPVRDTSGSRSMKWTLIEHSIGRPISPGAPPRPTTPVESPIKINSDGTVTMQTPRGPTTFPMRPRGSAR